MFKAPFHPKSVQSWRSQDHNKGQTHSLHTGAKQITKVLERDREGTRGPSSHKQGMGTGQEVSGGVSGLPAPLAASVLLPTLLLPRLPGLWVIGKINLPAQLARSNQSLGLGCNLIPWGGGRRVELSWGLSGKGSPHPTPLPTTVSGFFWLAPPLCSQSPTSLLSGLLFVCDPQGEHPHLPLISLTPYWFPLLLSWVLGGVQPHHSPRALLRVCP